MSGTVFAVRNVSASDSARKSRHPRAHARLIRIRIQIPGRSRYVKNQLIRSSGHFQTWLLVPTKNLRRNGARQNAMHTLPGQKTTTRLLAAVVRDVMRQQRFANSEPLRDAVRARCRELHVPCSPATLETAIDLVGSNTRLFTSARPSRGVPLVDPPPIRHAEAAAILHRLGVDVRGSRLRSAVPLPNAPEHFPALVPVR